MAAQSTDECSGLKTIFEKIWENYSSLISTDEATNSPKIQDLLKATLEKGEVAINQINMLQLFSRNEDIEEVSTNELRYMFLPAIMAHCTNQLSASDRLLNVEKAEIYYKDFLRLCRDYSIASADVPDLSDDEEAEETTGTASNKGRSSAPSLEDQQRQRKAKIERFKKKQEAARQLKTMEEAVSKGNADEESRRKYYLAQIDNFIMQSFEELEFLTQEKEMLAYMSKMKTSEKSQEEKATKKKDIPSKPLHPFIITKTQLQKEVYGLGYPSIPTYTLDEFYENQVQAGKLPPPGTNMKMPDPPSQEPSEEENAEKEAKIEKDDKETLQKARDWDEWKDDHRRGWGNTHNKG